MKKTPVRTLLLVALQVAVMAMLQFYTVLPVLGKAAGRNTGPSVCLGDHSLCGCPPERVEAKNCCCYLAERGEDASCCDSGRHDDGAGCTENTDLLPGVYSAPCGEGVKFLAPSGTTPDLLLPSAICQAVRVWRTHLYSPQVPEFTGRTPEPPEPPPKISC